MFDPYSTQALLNTSLTKLSDPPLISSIILLQPTPTCVTMSSRSYSTYNFTSFPDLDLTPAEEFLATSLFDVSQGIVGPSGFSIWRDHTHHRATTTTFLNTTNAPRDRVPFRSIEAETCPTRSYNTSQAGPSSSTASALHDNATGSPATTRNSTIPFPSSPVRPEVHPPRFESFYASQAGPSHSTASPRHDNATGSPATTRNSTITFPSSPVRP
ncbi:MAG TPA: hypothetical protein VGO47_01575, partial [Chlamydiales bacterium]|nr:hypothetical protein [Chlamydiales bacterium]